MMWLLGLLREYWDVALGVLLIVVVLLALGWRAALAAGIAVLSAVSYRQGRRAVTERDAEIRRKQVEDYRQIDSRPRSGSDAADRLRDGEF